MKKILVALVLLSCAHVPVRTIKDDVESTVRLTHVGFLKSDPETLVELSTCSGVVVSSTTTDSIVLTAAHCVVNDNPQLKPEKFFMVTTMDESKTCLGASIKTDSVRDLALLYVDCALNPMPFGDKNPETGDEVKAVGYPLGVDFPIITSGYASRLVAPNRMPVSAPVAVGMSGGAVVKDHRIVGIISKVAIDFHHIAIVVPLSSILEFMGP